MIIRLFNKNKEKIVPVAVYYYLQADICSSCERLEHEPLDPMHLKMVSYMIRNGDIFVLALVVFGPKRLYARIL